MSKETEDALNDLGEWLIPLFGLAWAGYVYFGGIVNLARGAL